MAVRLIAICVALFSICAPTALCQERFKQTLFEDCEEAQAEFAKYSVEQQRSFFDFLALVIGLNTQSPSAPEAFAVAPGGLKGPDSSLATGPKAPEFLPGAMWQTMDSKRELRAKRCALELFQSSSALAIDTIPTLVATYSEQALSDEIAVGLEETVALIAERAHKQGINPSQQQFESILAQLIGPRPLVAQNFIQEYLAIAAPYLISFIAKTAEPNIEPLVNFLRQIDANGARSMRTFIDLLPTLTQEEVSRLVRYLPRPTKDALPQFTNDFIRLAANPSLTRTFLPIVGEICVTLNGLAVDSSQESQIAQIPNILTVGTLDIESLSCLTSSVTGLARKVGSLLALNESMSQQRLGLSLLSKMHKNLPAEQRQQVYTRLKEMAVSSTPEITSLAIESLALFPEHRSESLSLAYQILKKSVEVKDATVGSPVLAATFKLVLTLEPGKDAQKIIPSLSKSLGTESPPPAVITLAAKIPQMEPELLNIISTQPPTSATHAALEALTAKPSIPRKAIQSLVELIRYPSCEQLSITALSTMGPPAAAAIRKALPKTPTAGRPAVLSALARLGAATKPEIAELADVFAGRECSVMRDQIQLLCALASISDAEQAIRAKILGGLNRCLAEFEPSRVLDVVRCAPDMVLASPPAITQIVSTSKDASLTDTLLDLAMGQPLITPDQVNLILSLLERSPPSAQLKLLSFIRSNKQVIPPTLRNSIRNLASTASKDEPIFYEAVHTLAATADMEFDWQHFVKRSIDILGKGFHRSEILQIMSILPLEIVLGEVLPALEQDNPDKLVGACMVGAALGSKAVPIVSKVWHLRETHSPSVRYAAVLALLQINPLTPDIDDPVRRILVNRYFPLAASLPIRWPQTVAVADLDKSSFGTLRTIRLEQLLVADQ